jgi:predicted alpha/beta superfamily hydrolase
MRLFAVLFLSLAIAASSTPLEAQEPVTVGTQHVVASKVLNEDREIVVWTPRGYDRGYGAFPVLYVTDAATQFFHTAATVDFLSRNGRAPAMIVVGLMNTDRTRDLTPYATDDPAVRERTPTAGGADRFLTFVETELVPWVEARYRTEPFRVFAGHSFGGLFATHVLATKPDLFNAIIAVSPTLPWNGGEPVKRVERLLDERRELPRSYVFTIGNEGPEMQEGFDALKALLERRSPRGFSWHAQQMPNDDHGSVVLKSHYYALEQIFDGWQLPVDAETRRFTGGVPALKAHYATLSERLQWKVLPPELPVNNLGYAALRQDRVDEALELFEMNVEHYPESANVYDSLADGLEAAGRLDEALARTEEAVRRGKATDDPLLETFTEHRDRLRKQVSN